jgi:hypothetical protein
MVVALAYVAVHAIQSSSPTNAPQNVRRRQFGPPIEVRANPSRNVSATRNAENVRHRLSVS